MTELDLYLQHIPMIAEIVVRCRKLSAQQYEEWKRKTVEASPDAAKEFIIKVLYSSFLHDPAFYSMRFF